MKLFIVCLVVWTIILVLFDLVKNSTSRDKINLVRVFGKGLVAGILTACILTGIVYIF